MEDYRGSNCICTGEAAEKLYRMQGKAEQKRREEADADHEAECIQPADESEADDNGSGRKRHGKRRLAEECGFRQHGNCEGIEVKEAGTFRLTAQKKAGSATLTITLKSGLSKKVKVTVKTTTIKTTKITVPTKVTMKARAKVTLTPILTPITSQEKITYATLDSKIVTVTSKGVVTAKKKGSGRILVRSGAVAVIVYVTVK